MKNYLNDENLSFKAKGIFAAMLALHEEGNLSQERIIELSSTGKLATLSGFKELKEKGYIKKNLIKDRRGKFINATWTLSETGDL